MKKIALLLVIVCFFAWLYTPVTMAAETGVKPGLSSLLIPGWGQYQNGEFETKSGKIKSGVMIAIEVAAIVTTAVLGGTVGAPVVWVGIGLFIANHVWSGLDAFVNAGKEPGVGLGTSSPHDKVDAK